MIGLEHGLMVLVPVDERDHVDTICFWFLLAAWISFNLLCALMRRKALQDLPPDDSLTEDDELIAFNCNNYNHPDEQKKCQNMKAAFHCLSCMSYWCPDCDKKVHEDDNYKRHPQRKSLVNATRAGWCGCCGSSSQQAAASATGGSVQTPQKALPQLSAIPAVCGSLETKKDV
jgi:hypothetical protein